MRRNKAYDVALSFAGEDRALAEAIALELKRRGVAVFYDRLEQADLWGKDLYQHLTDIYKRRAKYCLVFVSAAYVRKHWARLELQSAQDRALSLSREYILPVRLDDTELPGLPSTVAYVDARRQGVGEIADLLVQKLGRLNTRHGEVNGKAKPPAANHDLLCWKVLSAINSHDPMDLLPDAPSDEYAEEAQAVAALVPETTSVRQLAHSLRGVFASWFSPARAGPVQRYMELARDIWRVTEGHRAVKEGPEAQNE